MSEKNWDSTIEWFGGGCQNGIHHSRDPIFMPLLSFSTAPFPFTRLSHAISSRFLFTFKVNALLSFLFCLLLFPLQGLIHLLSVPVFASKPRSNLYSDLRPIFCRRGGWLNGNAFVASGNESVTPSNYDLSAALSAIWLKSKNNVSFLVDTACEYRESATHQWRLCKKRPLYSADSEVVFALIYFISWHQGKRNKQK